ncbi:DUF6629 family protein [Kitasatospora sp. MAP5-34]|uniref:DUF6629 family protein n=1 Tax=Kitasatospora sp. MAP5-34 TaxID=3035102 RepID=UPI0024755B6B|nr:DUF6629 family protein [Kitasatospora sp. MAP5-34]MDH6579141.1 hypothetical protein [Kitasatospora sp. MAP5-34]
MCWSAEADLIAGTVITGLGVCCLARVRRLPDVPLAALPLVLGAHQLIEAAVWSGAEGGPSAGAAQWARAAWAVIALPLLPVLVPLGVWCSARPPGQGPRAALALLGVAVAVPLAVAVAAHPVTAEIHGHTLRYGVGLASAPLLLACYLLVTVGSLLLSGDRLLRLLGTLVGLGAVLCGVLYELAFASTWCALAALASVVLLRWTGRPVADPSARGSGG